MANQRTDPLTRVVLPDKWIPRVLLSYPECSQATGWSERFIWQLVADGKLKAIREGRSVKIPVAALQEYIAERMADGKCESDGRVSP